MALTDRQKQIKTALQAGKKADEIANELGITTNAVYQQIRRMRNAGTSVKAGRKSGGKAGRKSAATKPAVTPQNRAGQAAAATPEPRVATPLQAIRARRSEIEADVKEADSAFKEAAREAEKRKEALDKLTEKHTEELKRLDVAEQAVKGELPKAAAKPKSGGKSPAKPKSAPKATEGAQPPPQPVQEPQGEAQAPAPVSSNGDAPAGDGDAAKTEPETAAA